MKILRIIACILCMNFSFSHAMQEPSLSSSLIKGVAQASLITGAGLALIEGACSIGGAKTTLPIPQFKSCQFANDVVRMGVGVVEVGVGLTLLAYAIE